MNKTKEELNVTEIISDSKSFSRIKDMLMSPDKENHVIALAILNQVDVKAYLPQLWLFYKMHGEANAELWKTEAPKALEVFERFKVNLADPDALTYQTIFRRAKSEGYPREVQQLVLDEFAKNFKANAVTWGMEFLADLELHVTDPNATG